MRALLDHERPLVSYLFELAGLSANLDDLRAEPMQDGGMGSLAFAPLGRPCGAWAAECQFHDADAVPVLATLYLDTAGAPFEVDMWKVNFEALIRWPTRMQLLAGLTAIRPNDIAS